MMKKLTDWILNQVNWEHTITRQRGNLMEAFRNIREVGVSLEDAKIFIRGYNFRAFTLELSNIGSPLKYSQGFREPRKDYATICEIANANKVAKLTGEYPQERGRESCWRYV